MEKRKHPSVINLQCPYLLRFLGVVCLLPMAPINATTYYVDTKGSDSAAGAIDRPFASLKKGHDKAAAGDTIYIRGGTYAMSAGITITKSGSSDTKRIHYWAYQNEKPIFDFAGMGSSSLSGILVSRCNWLHFRGLEVCNVPQFGSATPNCVLCNYCGHITFEQCNFHHNGGTGLFFAYGTGGHLILNCDSHDNYDPLSGQGDGQNADGFGVHYQTAGTDTTIIRGCRAWWNSDDGFDCIHQNVAVIVENTWVWLNGYKPGTMTRAPAGNGQGIKGGGYNLPPDRVPAKLPQNIIRFCVSFLNGDKGFNTNYHPIADYWYNNTGFNNKGGNFFMQGITISGSDYTMTPRGILKNNVAFTGTAITSGAGSGVDAANNSWNLSGVSVSGADFLSIDTAGIYGQRKADGSLPDVKFMHLSATSKLIDKGTDVGFAFSGAAPDLGAFEYGATALRMQPSFRSTMPVIFSGEKSDPQKNLMFDPIGRRLDNGAVDRAFRPLIYKTLQLDGGRRACLVIRLQ